MADGVAPPASAPRPCERSACLAAGGDDAEPVPAAQHRALLAQLHALADFVDGARRDVASIGIDHIIGSDMPAATEQLDAVLLHTAEATGQILDECEKLERAADATILRSAVTATTSRIYEACSFQDITGQRLAKVVLTLKAIEARIGEMLRAFDQPGVPCQPAAAPAVLHGPQRSGDAMAQHDVDALLASFE